MWRPSAIGRNYNVAKSFIRYYADHGGDPTRAMPFDISNKKRFSVLFFLYFGSGFAAPWLIVRYQILKGSN